MGHLQLPRRALAFEGMALRNCRLALEFPFGESWARDRVISKQVRKQRSQLYLHAMHMQNMFKGGSLFKEPKLTPSPSGAAGICGVLGLQV